MRKWCLKSASVLARSLFSRRARSFNLALNHPENAQRIIFNKIYNNLSESLYGKSLNISGHVSYHEFSSKVPILKYDDLVPWIEKQKAGIQGVLTPQPVKFYEKTSGSGGRPKYIPYNNDLMKSFNNMFQIWAYDILKYNSVFETGKIFISVSPPVSKEHSPGKIPVGMNDDSQYLNFCSRLLIKPFLIYPPQFTATLSIDDFRYLLAATLLAEEKLEIVSIWNPTYLLVLLDTISTFKEKLIKDLSNGEVKLNNIAYHFTPLKAGRIKLLLQSQIPWREIWKDLKLISCWSSGSAQYQSQQLSRLFPDVYLQGKGLLATEAPITIPLIQAPAPVPLVDEVFFEFIDNKGGIQLLHQLQDGEEYQLIISQKGGLYRYDIGDKIRVTGKYRETPCLEFIGRTNNTCDLVGEKLTENCVNQALKNIYGNQPPYCILVPLLTKQGLGRYILFSEIPMNNMSLSIEKELCRNYHYANARILGQLSEAITISIPNIKNLIQDFMCSKGMRLGDIKDVVLLTNTALASELINQLAKHNVQLDMLQIIS